MRAGYVAPIRVNPKDCQSVLDLMDLIGMDTKGQSFPAMVSLALSSLLETHRQSGHLPEPDPFDYNNRMQYFHGQQRSAKKLQVAKIIHETGPKIRVPVMPEQRTEGPNPTVATTPRLFPQTAADAPEDIREIRTAFRELYDKKQAAKTTDGITWSKTDQAEYDRLYSIVYPEG